MLNKTAATAWRGLRALPTWVYPAIVALVVLVLASGGASYSLTQQIELSLLLAFLVSGLNLSLGYSGQLALGQPAMYAAGAYTAGLISNAGLTDVVVQIVAAGLVALVIGVVTGIPGLRLGSWSLAMTSFFLVLLVPDVVQIFQRQTGGSQGLTVNNLPTLFGLALGGTDYYMAVVIVAILWFTVFRNLIQSRHGIAFKLLKHSPVLAASVGISVNRKKLAAYAMSAIPAGIAGALFANLELFVTPADFDFALVTGALAACIFGGSASIYGALLGAAVVQYGDSKSNTFAEYSLVFFGAFLVAGGVLLRGGVTGLVRRLVARLDRAYGIKPERAGDAGVVGHDDLPPIPGGRLDIHGVSKSFGGNRALTDVNLTAAPGRITALIGPNGSGKTTLLNLVCGFYRREEGTIAIDGSPLHRTAHKIARGGVARTFQTPLIPPGVTVREVVASGRYSLDPASFAGAIARSPGFRRVRRRDRERSDQVLSLVGLAELAGTEAAFLPLSMRRMLEIGRAVAAQPRVLLLDEIASGLDAAEIETLAALIGRMRAAGATIVIVEHNFDLVLSLADEVVVLARGSVLAVGPPAEIEANEQVRKEYLGQRADAGQDSDESVAIAPPAGTGE
jgi:branched-chain amino acid transport system permease protein